MQMWPPKMTPAQLARLVALAGVAAIASVAAPGALAQLEVQDSSNPPFDPDRLIRDVFLGEGVDVVSIQYDGPQTALGYFKEGTGPVGMDEGIIMTTGRVGATPAEQGVDAPSQEEAQTDNGSLVVDANLQQIVDARAGGTNSLHNVSRYTIRFVPKGDRVKFRYVFASEEYPQFVCSDYNDLFGFFLRGPGIAGPFAGGAENLAVVPGTALPVSINTVNPGSHGAQGSATGCDPPEGSLGYSSFFVDNQTPGNQPIYDGMTTIFVAESSVTPCQEYIMEIAIADVGDPSYDSGVFLEAKSFSTPTLAVEVETVSLAGQIAEGCTPAEVIFRANEIESVPRTIPYTVGGSATPGTDYSPLTGFVTLPAGADEVRIPITAFADGLAEGAETVEITVQVDLCTSKTVSLEIVDRSIPPVPLVLDTTVCPGASVPLDGTLAVVVDTPVTFVNDNRVNITRRNDPVYRDIFVAGVTPSQLRKGLLLEVCVRVTNNRPEDIDMYLFGPNGNYIELSTDNGGNTPNGYNTACFTSDAVLRIDDPAATSPFTGTYLPEGNWSELWDGTTNDANGVWSLQIVDDTNGSTTVFREWSLTFAPVYDIDYAWSPAAGLSCADCPDPVANPSSTTTYTLTARDSYGCEEQAAVRVAHEPPVAAPSVTCSSTVNSITWNWPSDPGAVRYEISVDGGAPIDVGTSLTHTETGLGFNVTQTAVVTAYGTCDQATGTASCTTSNCPAYPLSASATDASCAGAADGAVVLTAGGGGTAPFTYSLGGVNNATGAFGGLPAGAYTASVIDANSCPSTTSFIIAEPAPVSASTAVAAPSSCGAAYTATASAAGGSAPYTYVWDGGQTGATASFSVSGTYAVTVTDDNGCTAQATADVTVADPLDATFATSEISCSGAADGVITALGNAGFPPYGYSIGAGFGASGNFANLGPGTYTVTVRDAIGCEVAQPVTLADPDAIALAVSAQDVSCNGGNDGSATATVSGGTAPYTITWPGGATGLSVNDLPAGTYSANVVDDRGCTSAAPFVIGEPGPLAATLTSADADCAGAASGELTVAVSGGRSPYTYAWSTGDATSTPTLAGVAAGSYMVTVTDDAGCTTTASATVGEPAPLSIGHTTLPVGCAGEATGEINLTVAGGTPPYSYRWQDGNTDEDRTALAAGTYDVDVTDANGCVATYSVTLDEATPLAFAWVIDDVSCFGYADGRIDVTVTGGRMPYSHEWTGPNGYAFFNQDPAGLVAGDYTLEFRDAGGCTYTETFTVAEPIAISLATVPGDTICNGASDGTARVTVTGGTAPFTYLWDSGETAADAVALDAGAHTVDVVDANGCAFAAEALIEELPPISLELSQNGVSCYGDSDGEARVVTVRYGADARDADGLTYRWDDAAATAGREVSGLRGTETVEVVATDARGCEARALITIAEPTELRAAVERERDVLCAGGASGVAVLSAEGATPDYTYAWLSPTATPNAARVEDLTAGTHEGVVTDANGCADTVSVTLVEPDSISIESSVFDVNCFSRRSGRINVVASGGTSPYAYGWDVGRVGGDIDSLEAGTYALSVVDDNGCALLETYEVGTASDVVLEGAATGVSCFGERNGAVELVAGGGNGPHEYSIEGAAWTEFPDFRYLLPGEYAALARDRDGCPSDTLYLTVPEPDPLVIDAGDDISVQLGEELTLRPLVLNANGPVEVNWLPNDPAFISCDTCMNPVVTPTFQGVLTVLAIDSAGCEAEDRLQVRIEKTVLAFVPTGFTPNADGNDDRLVVHGKTGTRVVSFRVFDRWGQLVHESGDYFVNDESRGWDGQARGRYADGGVYIWRAEVRYRGGIVQALQGETTLIR